MTKEKLTPGTPRRTALHLAKRIAARAAELSGYPVDSQNGPNVRNRKQTREHGWMPSALATVCMEGEVGQYDDLLDLTLNEPFITADYYVEAYSSWLVGIYPRR